MVHEPELCAWNNQKVFLNSVVSRQQQFILKKGTWEFIAIEFAVFVQQI
jgi:hypothetical protein